MHTNSGLQIYGEFRGLSRVSAKEVPEVQKEHGFVYCMTDFLNPKLVKIGHSQNVPQRENQLNSQTASPGTLRCAFYFACSPSAVHERRIFKALSILRIARNKEWFHMPPSLACQCLTDYFGRPPDFKAQWLQS
ncbi:MAG: GIY-YIG nuclease family protein [bacterium]|jgi:hypothetical protein